MTKKTTKKSAKMPKKPAVKRAKKPDPKTKRTSTVKKAKPKRVSAAPKKNIFDGATEISMTEGKISIVKRQTRSENGKYSHKETREYHDRTPDVMKQLEKTMSSRECKKVTVKLK